jgi:hypothetical protein
VPEEVALLPPEPRNRQEILPLGCWNFQQPPLDPGLPLWITFPKEWVVRIRSSTAKSPVPGFSRLSCGMVTRCSGSAGGVLGRM